MKSADQIVHLSPREWMISVVAHVVIFAILIYLIPAKAIVTVFSKPVPTPKEQYQDPTQVHEVVRDIAQEQAEAARERVKQLADLYKRLNTLTTQRLDAYHQQIKTAADAAKDTLQQLQKIPTQQDATLHAHDQLAQQLQKLSSDPSPADEHAVQALRDQVTNLQQQVSSNHSITEDQQEKALQLLHSVAQDSPPNEAQKKANDAEAVAASSEQQALQAQDRFLNNLSAQVRQTAALKRSTDTVTSLSAQLDQANQAATQAQSAVDAAKTANDAANAIYQQALPKLPADKQTADADRQAFIQTQQALNQAKSTQDQLGGKVKGLQSQLQAWQKNQSSDTDKLAKMQADSANSQTQMQGSMDKAKSDETAAKQAQLDSIAQFSHMANNPPPPTDSSSSNAQQTPNAIVPDDASLQGRNLGQLYQSAQEMENQITDRYRTYRAAELASIQKLTLSDAMQDTQVARPNRDKLNVPLLSGQDADKNFDGYKAEVNKANQQMQSMVSLSSNMVSLAEAQKNVGQGDVQLQQDHYNQMVASATADDSAVGKDLTGATGGNNGGNGTGSGSTGTRNVSKQVYTRDSAGAASHGLRSPEAARHPSNQRAQPTSCGLALCGQLVLDRPVRKRRSPESLHQVPT